MSKRNAESVGTINSSNSGDNSGREGDIEDLENQPIRKRKLGTSGVKPFTGTMNLEVPGSPNLYNEN